VPDVGELPISSDLERRTAWFIRLRWLAVCGVAAAAGVARLAGLPALPLGPIVAVAAGLALYNAALYSVALRLRARPVKNSWSTGVFARLLVPRTYLGLGDDSGVARAALFAFLQISVDFLFLAVLLHFSGGIASPFTLFFVFHVVIASILLSRRATYFETTIGFLLLVIVVLGEYFGILDHHLLASGWQPDAYQSRQVIVMGLAVVGATLYLASYLCSTVAVDLRERVRANLLLSREIAEEKCKVEAAYDSLRETERAKSQYMRKVAHELRGPLGTIETALKVVLQGVTGKLDEPSRDLISRAARRAGELATVTHDLLVLARAREAEVGAQRVTVALDALLAEVIEDLRPTAQRKSVALGADAGCACSILGDPAALRQLIANLVENGIRYTGPGGSVAARLLARDGSVVLEVEDTGIGIAEDDLPHVFEEFYRGANAREYTAEGTGLGLAICKVIAERHGGNIEVGRRVAGGTRFAVTLPGASRLAGEGVRI